MLIKKVAILGFGTMGSNIAQVCATSGFETYCKDISQEFIDRGMSIIEKNLNKDVSKEKISKDKKEEILSRIHTSTKLEDVANVDLVIEAIIEDIELKKKEFSELDKLAPSHTIFASNTSSLSITEMAAVTNRQDKFIGLHFFNPAVVMKLVEVIKGLTTSDETFNITYEFVKQIGKEPIKAKDNPGFVVNLLLIPYLNDAAKAYENGVASAEDIDKAMKLGAGYPMGPLALIDLIGIDVTVKVGDILYNAYKDPKYAPPPIMRRMVQAGFLGRKTGKGFYTY